MYNPVVAKSTLLANDTRFQRANILMFLAIFPYVTPVNLGFDTQPFALLFSIIILLTLLASKSPLPMPRSIFTLLLMSVCASVLFLVSSDKLAALRSLTGYATLFAVTFSSYHTCRNINTKWFNFAVYMWFSVGLIQLTVNRFFGEFLLPRISTSEGRGITSLAVEPSYYAIVCVFLLLLNDFLRASGKQEKSKHMLITMLLIFQIVITYSGVGFVFLFVYMISKFIAILLKEGIRKHTGKLTIIAFSIVATFLAFRNIDVLEQSRAGVILRAAMVDPKLLLTSDGSIADRLTHAILPIYSLAYSSGIGLGLGTWSEHFPGLRDYAGGFIRQMAEHATGGRIMSGWGTAIYELGILGFLYLIIFLQVMIKGAKRKELSSVYVSSGITLFLLMFMAVPLAFPLFSYLLGMYMRYSSDNVQNV